MNCKIEIIPRTLLFKHPAGTSRGIYTERRVWYLRLTSSDYPVRVGIGECAPLPKLSCDDLPDYEQILTQICKDVEERGGELDWTELEKYPSIAFGLKTAFQHFEAKSLAFEKTPFSRGKRGIPINGLIWMGDRQYMFEQIKEKIEAGFRCLKLKIGAINFEEELELLQYVRQQFTSKEIQLRVDANGAFSPSGALEKLKRLSDFDLHSIEQPIPAGNWEAMRYLTHTSPLPIALDEELIGYNTIPEQSELLETILPQYIVLKPSLHGDVDGWVMQASRLGIEWWATSALESNIGLNAIAQWVGEYKNTLTHGLGTGMLFTENVKVPLAIQGDELWYYPRQQRLPLI